MDLAATGSFSGYLTTLSTISSIYIFFISTNSNQFLKHKINILNYERLILVVYHYIEVGFGFDVVISSKFICMFLP